MLVMKISSQAIVCRPDFCDNIVCDPDLPRTCSGTIKQNSSVCGCCPTCVTVLPPYSRCLDVHILVASLNFSRTECWPGYTCRDGICRPFVEIKANLTN
ncbi:hypothetical protein O3M35_002042 [Rhynocoris fuscipes]|uniref:Uncharacterized protein n=1 Tax=Rhynocoris fuscipes TaxID=488301 RepID=A0AAW1CR24_9HEMI